MMNLVGEIEELLVEVEDVMKHISTAIHVLFEELQMEDNEVAMDWEIEAFLIGLLDCVRGIRFNGDYALAYVYRFVAFATALEDLEYFYKGLVWYLEERTEQTVDQANRAIKKAFGNWEEFRKKDLEANYNRLSDLLSTGEIMAPDLYDAMQLINNVENFERLVCSSRSNLNRCLKAVAHDVVQLQIAQESEISLTELQMDDTCVLSSGGFGEIVLGNYGTQQVAIKKARNMSAIGSFKLLDDLRNEAQAWRKLQDHKNVCKFIGMASLNDQVVLVMEKCDTSLYRYVHEEQHEIKMEQIEAIMLGMVRGLEFLHSNSVLHRLLTPENVLINAGLGKVRLCNFGLPDSKSNSETFDVGNHWGYVAPEAIRRRRKWNTRSDMFSYAMICWELLHREMPWDGSLDQLEAYEKVYKKQERPEFDAPGAMMRPWIQRIIENCWEHEPSRRPFAAEVGNMIEMNQTQKRRSTRILKSMVKSFRATRPKSIVDGSKAILEAKSGDIVIQLMKKYKQLPRIQETGCEKLRAFALTEYKKVQLVHLGAGEAVIQAMENHPDDLDVQEQALAVLWTLSLNENNKAKLMELGAGKSIVKAMKHHRIAIYLQENACGSLWSLATHSTENQIALIKQGAVDELLMTMKYHANIPEVVKQALGALWMLSLPDQNLRVFIERNIRDIVIESMRTHVRDAEIQKIACKVLREIDQRVEL